MPKEYQGESEDSTASKKERMKIKKKKHLPFLKNKPKKFNEAIEQPMRGMNMLGPLLRGLRMELDERGREEGERKAEEFQRRERHKKRAKRSDSLS